MDNYEISNYEYCKNVNRISTCYPRTMRAYIPKYMPNISGGNWQHRVSIASNLFVNASECAVSIPNTVTEQGYYTVHAYSNEKLDFTSKYEIELGYIPTGQTFLLEVMYEDPQTVKLTGKV